MRFSCNQPPLSLRDYELIKLTAYYASQHKWFAKEATKRGPEFSFLKQGHSLNPFFNSLVAQYKILSSDVPEPSDDVMHRAIERANKAVVKERTMRRQVEDFEKERKEYATVDWKDFVVVESVDFGPKDLLANLPPPKTREDLEYTPIDKKGSVISETEPQSLLVSPFTGEKIPASEYDAHVKKMTLDPRYNEQKKLEAERTSNSNLVYDEAHANLKRFSQARASTTKRRKKKS